MNSPHLYLEGVVKIAAEFLPKLEELLVNDEFLKVVTKEAADRIYSKTFLASPDSGYQDIFLDL